MPYLPIARPSPEDLQQEAERRWQVLHETHPDLTPAVDLQRRLLTLVLELTGTLEAAGMPRLSLPPKYLAAKLSRAVPVFAGEPIALPVPVLGPMLLRFCSALAEGGAGDAARHIGQAIENGSIDPGSLLTASLGRNEPAIRTGAVHRGLAPDLVWLVAELAVSPYVHGLQRLLLGAASKNQVASALATWSQGYCPACGSWPAVAEVVGGHRWLRCSFCASAWEITSYACIYCEHAGEQFVTAAPNEERKDRRIEVCGACGGYLKAIDIAAPSPFPLLSISDIETTDLDMAAMEHGYRRPALKQYREYGQFTRR